MVANFTELRKRAEEILKESSADPMDLSFDEIKDLLHELQVHQIELEMQNEELRRTQHALEKAHQRYVDLYDFAPVGYLTLDEDARIIEVNLTGAAMLGTERENLIGKPFARFVAKDNQDAWYQWYRQLDLAPSACEVRLTKAGGASFCTLISSAAVQTQQDENVQYRIVISDITKCKQAEEQLAYQAQLLQDVSDAIISSDLDFNIVSWNQAAETLYGWRADEVIGRPVVEVTQLEYPYHEQEQVIVEFLENAHWEGEFIQRRKDGTVLNIYGKVSIVRDSAGNPVGAVAINRDITEQKQAEAALKQRTHELGERVKELNCLYAIADLVEQHSALDAIFRGVVNLLPPSWQYPEITCARILFKDQEFRTANFRQTTRKQSQDIVVDDEQHGVIEVYYLEEKPQSDERTFLREERNLIDAIAERLGRVAERKQNEEALRESEARFQLFMEHLPGAVFIKSEDEQTLYCNTYYASMVGCSPEELIGTSANKYVPPDIEAAFAEEDRQVLAEQHAHEFQHTFPGPDGPTYWMTVKFPIPRSSGPPLLGAISLDITERRQAEDALRETQTQLQAILDNTPAVIYLKDLESRFLLVNRAFEEAFHVTQQEVFGKTSYDLVDAESADEHRWNDLYVLESGEPYQVEESAIFKGECRTVISVKFPMYDSEGTLYGVCGISTDITERKWAEEALRESEEKFRSFIQQSSDGIVLVDETGTIIEWNRSMESITTIMADEVKEQLIWDVLYRLAPERLQSPAAYEQLKNTLLDSLQTGEASWLFEPRISEFQRPDGGQRYVQVVMFPIKTSKGYRIGSILRDITQSKHAEQKLRESEARARALLEAIPDLMFRLSRDGEYLDYKAQTSELHDQSGMLIGKNLADNTPPEFVALVMGHIEKALTTDTMQIFEYDLPIPGQGVHDYEARMVPSGSDEVTAIVRDITERKRVDEAIARRNNTLQALYGMALDIGAELELSFVLQRTLDHAKQLLDVRQTGGISLYRPDEDLLYVMESYGSARIAIGATIKPGEGLAGQAFLQGRPVIVEQYNTWENRLLGLDDAILGPGLGVPLRWRNQIIGSMAFVAHADRQPFDEDDVWLAEMFAAQVAIAIVNADLYERQQQYNLTLEDEVHRQTVEIRRQHEQTQAILQNVGDAVVLTDTKGHITYVNQAFTNLLKYTPEAMVGKHISLLQGQSITFSTEHLEAVDAGRSWNNEIVLRCADDDIVEVATTFVPVHSPNGEVESFVASIQDIGRFKQLERMKTRFMQTVSHELRTPLSSIRLYTRLLQSEKAQDEATCRKYLEKLDSETGRLVQTAEKVLDATRFAGAEGPETWQAFLVADLFKDITERFKPHAERLQKTLVVNAPALRLQGDPDWLARALAELVENAIKFTGEGGIVTLSARLVEESDVFKIAIEVCDDGRGIEAARSHEICETFERGAFGETGHIPGIGLGLSIAQLILNHHRGELLVESAPEHGSTFTMMLPIPN